MWAAVAGAQGYHIQYSSDNVNWSFLKTTGTGDLVTLGAGVTSEPVTGGAGFYFRVSAFNAAGETFSASILAAKNQQGTAPAAPTQLTWTATTGDNGILTWSAVAGAEGYDVQYWDGRNWVTFYKAGANETSLAVTNGNGHYLRVGAFSAAGEAFSDYIYADNGSNIDIYIP
jgi:hypothetical protein